MISRVQSNNAAPSFGALKINPVIELGPKVQNFLTKAADFSSVHQRLALGIFAFAVQPLIDLKNKEVDEDTRKVSAVRSAAKALIGTTTGIIVRGGCNKIAQITFAKKDAAGNIIREIKENGKKGAFVIDPAKVQKAFGKGFESLHLDAKKTADAIKRVPLVVGTIAALVIMIFSNFIIDAPLTNATMDKINEFMDKHFAKKQKAKESAGAKND